MATYIMRTGRGPGGTELGYIASALIVAAILVAILYIGSPILQPLVIAGLLAFILSPVIRRLRNLGLWRTPAVLLTVLSALAALILVSTTIVVQITQLADDLPKYQTNLGEKVRALGGSSFTSSALNRASASLKDLEKQISRPQEGGGAGKAAARRGTPARATRYRGSLRAPKAADGAAGDDGPRGACLVLHPAAARGFA